MLAAAIALERGAKCYICISSLREGRINDRGVDWIDLEQHSDISGQGRLSWCQLISFLSYPMIRICVQAGVHALALSWVAAHECIWKDGISEHGPRGSSCLPQRIQGRHRSWNGCLAGRKEVHVVRVVLYLVSFCLSPLDGAIGVQVREIDEVRHVFQLWRTCSG